MLFLHIDEIMVLNI